MKPFARKQYAAKSLCNSLVGLITANPVETTMLLGGLFIGAIASRYVLTVDIITSPSFTMRRALDGAFEKHIVSVLVIPVDAETLQYLHIQFHSYCLLSH